MTDKQITALIILLTAGAATYFAKCNAISPSQIGERRMSMWRIPTALVCPGNR